jgi:hypothetical protein
MYLLIRRNARGVLRTSVAQFVTVYVGKAKRSLSPHIEWSQLHFVCSQKVYAYQDYIYSLTTVKVYIEVMLLRSLSVVINILQDHTASIFTLKFIGQVVFP